MGTPKDSRPDICNRFLNILYRFADRNSESAENKAMGLVYEFFFLQFEKDNFNLCNRILENVEVDRLPSVVLVSLLTVSAHGERRLPARTNLYWRAHKRILEVRGPERTPRILVGLEPRV